MQQNPTIASLGTVLGVWAHPDDEAYLSAGLMHLARRAGNRVAVVTATAGERGTDDPSRWPPHWLAVRRRSELRESLAELGVAEHHVLGLADGSCDLLPFDEGVALVEWWMRRVRPDTVLTFGPDGMTGHPDHRAVSRWTTAAWETTGRRSRLLYATVTPEFHRLWGADNDRIGLWMDGAGPNTDAADLALAVECDQGLLERKARAIAAHGSQVGPVVEALGERWRDWWSTEAFVDATHERELAAA